MTTTNNLNFLCPCGNNVNMQYAAHAENHVMTCKYFLNRYNHGIRLIKELVMHHFLMPKDFMLLVFLINIYSKGKDKIIFSSYMDYSNKESFKEKTKFTHNISNNGSNYSDGEIDSLGSYTPQNKQLDKNTSDLLYNSLSKLKARTVESNYLSKEKLKKEKDVIGFEKQYPSTFKSGLKNKMVMPGPEAQEDKRFVKKEAQVIYPSVYVPPEEIEKIREDIRKSQENREKNNLTFGDEEKEENPVMNGSSFMPVSRAPEEKKSTPFDSNKSIKSLKPNIFKTNSKQEYKEKTQDIDSLILESVNMCKKSSPSIQISAHFKSSKKIEDSLDIIQQEYEHNQSDIDVVMKSLENLKVEPQRGRKTTGLICEHYNLKINCNICCQTLSHKYSIECFYCQNELSPTVSNILNSVENKIYKTWCGHSFHYNCIENCMMKGWKPNSRITFDFMDCPICGKDLDLPEEDSLAGNLYSQFKKIKNHVLLACLKKLKTEGLINCKALTAKESLFYKKPKMLALSCYVCYECETCKKPYVAGRIKPRKPNEDREKELLMISPGENEMLICKDCSIFEGCSLHHLDYTKFKCRYCCKKAVWFCFGTTHFCSGCFIKYKRDNSWIKNSKNWGKCEKKCDDSGKLVCSKLEVYHPDNPTELKLGCIACDL